MKIVPVSLFISCFLCFGAYASKSATLKAPKVPYIEKYKCTDKIERVYIYLKPERSSDFKKGKKVPADVVLVEALENDKFAFTSELAPWNRFSMSFHQKETPTHLYKGTFRGGLNKSVLLKPGSAFNGTFYSHRTEKGETKTLLTIWKVKRVVGTPKEVSFNGQKVTVYELTETANRESQEPTVISALYAPSIGAAIKYTTNESGKEVTCNLASFTKIK